MHKFAHQKEIMKLGNCWRKLMQENCTTTRYCATAFPARATENVIWDSAKPFNKIPSDLMLPFIGTAWTYMPIIGRYSIERLHLARKDMRNRLGDIIREKVGSYTCVLCFSNEDAERLVKSEGPYPYRTELSSFKTYRESRKEWFSTIGLIVEQGKGWYDLRNKTQKHLLRPRTVQAYLEPIRNVARDFVHKIYDTRDENKETPQLSGDLHKWALESVTVAGLDTRLGCLQRELAPNSDGMRMIQSTLTQHACINKLEPFMGNLPFWKLFSTPTWRKYVRACDVYFEIAFKYINKALEDVKCIKDHDNEQLTLLQGMLVTKDLSPSDAAVFVADMLLAGVETTSYAAGFLLYHLAKNPEKQEIMHQEIMKLLPTKDVQFSPKIYENLKYTKACLKEALRLNPIIAGTSRTLACDTVLSGYQVPKGTLVFMSFEEMFMNEKRFKSPERFIPERWLNAEEKIHPFSFFPFGIGPRSCVGKRLAELEVVTLMTEVIRNFRVEYHWEDIGYVNILVNAPDKPLRFKFIER